MGPERAQLWQVHNSALISPWLYALNINEPCFSLVAATGHGQWSAKICVRRAMQVLVIIEEEDEYE